MDAALSLLGADIAAVWRSIALWEWVRYAMGIVFIGVMFMPLKGIDRRDTWTAVTYMLVISVYAVALLIGIPALVEDHETLTHSALFVCASAALAAARWFIGNEANQGQPVMFVVKEKSDGNPSGSAKDSKKAA